MNLFVGQKVSFFEVTITACAHATLDPGGVFKVHVNVVVANGPPCGTSGSGLRKLSYGG